MESQMLSSEFLSTILNTKCESKSKKGEKTLFQVGTVKQIKALIGVAVPIWISTKHRKSYIDLHNAWIFVKCSKIQSFTYIPNAIIQQVIFYTTEQNSYLKYE